MRIVYGLQGIGLVGMAIGGGWIAQIIGTPVAGIAEVLGQQAVRDAQHRGMMVWVVVVIFCLLSLLAFWMAVRPFPPADPETRQIPKVQPPPNPPAPDTAIKADDRSSS